jgi:hypothetical protein
MNETLLKNYLKVILGLKDITLRSQTVWNGLQRAQTVSETPQTVENGRNNQKIIEKWKKNVILGCWDI